MPTLTKRERRETPKRDDDILHCFPFGTDPGDKALCGTVKRTRKKGHPNAQKCVVCLALAGESS